MLTGKAKQLFDKWAKSNNRNENINWALVNGSEIAYTFDGSLSQLIYLKDMPLSMQFGVYQQWADSMGYDVYTFMGDVSLHFSTIYDFNSDIDPISIECKTREEAQRAAIEKLNQIINER